VLLGCRVPVGVIKRRNLPRKAANAVEENTKALFGVSMNQVIDSLAIGIRKVPFVYALGTRLPMLHFTAGECLV
jgi:hypothetical protein